jgi:Uma2 family endonuclease
MATAPPHVTSEVHYPDSDGQPMGETGIHVNATIELFLTIKRTLFGGRPDVYVAADMFFYYEQGNPGAVKAPDIMVIKGVSHTEERRSFKLWVENRVPSVVFEFTSKKTRRDDTTIKPGLYARLGIAELFLFDPLGEYLTPRFQGFRLEGDRYEPIAPDADGGMMSRELGLKLRAIGSRVRLVNPRDGKLIAGPFDQQPDRLQADEALQQDVTAERVAREKLERKAKREARKFEVERRKTEELEAEVARLRALLGERGDDRPARSGD